jgi:hypothetical protein
MKTPEGILVVTLKRSASSRVGPARSSSSAARPIAGTFGIRRMTGTTTEQSFPISLGEKKSETTVKVWGAKRMGMVTL